MTLRLAIRWRRVLIAVLSVIAVGVLLLFLFQDKLIYMPHPYASAVLPPGFEALRFTTAEGEQTAYARIPTGVPARICVLFGGNAALALDWASLVDEARDPEAAFLLIDYPGYGACAGKASPATIDAAAEGAFVAFAARLGESPVRLEQRLRVFGHSLGAAAALQFACAHPVDQVVLVSPFTSLRDMARRTAGWPLCWLLRHNFDNRARLRELATRPRPPRVVIIHGDADQVVPIAMGRELAALVPGSAFHAIPGADHNTVVDHVADLLPALRE
jgi:pimeloyl-ACP methyl ester carboxylesterase